MLFKSNFFRAYGFWHWGEGFQTVLFTWYMTFHANLSATEIGFFQALVLSPFLVFTIAGGALTDKIGARLSYVVSTSLFAAILIGYGILDYSFGYVPQLFFLYCVAAGVVSAVSNPAIDTFIPDASPLAVQDNSLLAATAHNIAKLTGTLTGLLLSVLLSLGGFVANGLLMLLSVVFLQAHAKDTSRRPAPKTVQPAITGGVIRRIVRHYRACPENFDILLSSVILGLFVVPAGYMLWPLVLRDRFPEYGNLIALVNISSWIGAITVTAIAKRFSYRIVKPGRLSLLVWFGYGAGLLVLIYVGSFAALCLTVMVFGSAKVGKALVYGKYLHNSPDDERGVLIGVDQTAFWGLATVGTFCLGALVDLIGLNATIVGTAACIMISVICLTLRGRLMAMEPA